MLKKRVQSKKKKLQANNNINQKINLTSHADKLLFKITGNLLSPKTNTHNFTTTSNEFAKIIKSTNATPINKSKKSSKENLYNSIFQSTKTSENITPFDYDREIRKTKLDFSFLYQIGSGGFGRVWKVQQKKTKNVYAMKQMLKAKIISKKSVGSIMNQKQLLDQLSHPFIINSCDSFQDRDNLYLVMQYLRGGDLRYHMCFYQNFNEEETKFIVCCIVIALEYIHSCNIIHRDLKPENIVFQENGYVRITDFGVARKKKQENSQQTSGTPGYMAPEVICRMNHSFQADFFALGVIIYELIFGTRPYLGDSRKQIRQKILAHQAKISILQLPPGWSPNCMDFVNGLLKRNRQSRLGAKGISQLKNHPWLKSVNWQKILKKQIQPCFIPGIICQSREYQREIQNSVQSEVNQEAVMLLRTNQIQKLFKNYQSNKKRHNVFKPRMYQQNYTKIIKKMV